MVYCYTGIGSQTKSGNHTKKELLKAMNIKFNSMMCKTYTAGLKCKACKNHNYWTGKRISTKKLLSKENLAQNKKCMKCVNKKKKKCSINDFLSYSGASVGKCQK